MTFARAFRLIGGAALGTVLALFLVAGHGAALEQIEVEVTNWSSPDGHGYVGVKATGQWAPPAEQGKPVRTTYWSEWRNMGTPSPYCHAWWVLVHRTSDGSIVNPASPASLVTCGPESPIGIRASGFGDMSLYLAVAVDPPSAPARSERTVTAELTAGWRDYLDKAISAYVIPSSVAVDRWTVDFGDGTRRTFPGTGAERLSTTHRFDAGTFDVVVTARVSGRAYGAFFSPAGDPYEEVVPFVIDISNRATGTALPVEYVPPVVVLGVSPSGTLADGTPVGPDAVGHTAIWWPRGLHCELYVRARIEREGVIRSGGIVIGGARTRLLRYAYEGGVNNAADATPPGVYPATTPIAIQWNRPLPGRRSYPVRLRLVLETRYADGSVRRFEVGGVVTVTVVYSALSH